MTSAVFHHSACLENGLPKFHDFPGIVGTLGHFGTELPDTKP